VGQLVLPTGLVATLAVAAFAVAILAAVATPVLQRVGRLAPWRGPLILVPYAMLLVAALLAAAASGLGFATSQHVGVREVATAGLAIMCLTPLIGVVAVRLRYGAPGARTFQQQIAANRSSSILLVGVLLEVVAVTGFLVGAGVGIAFGVALLAGLVVAGASLVITLAATAFCLARGEGFLLDLADARPAGPGEEQLRNVVTELAAATGIPAPAVYVIETQTANAMSVGRDSAHASIAVTRGLLDRLDREQLQGVVAHELAHVANLDSRHAMLVALLVGAVVILTEVFFALVVEIATHPWIGGDSISEAIAGFLMWVVIAVVGLVFAGTLKLFAPIAAFAVQAAVSRDREYLADATAVAITRNPAGLIGALAALEGTRGAMAAANPGTQHLWIVNPVREGSEGGRGWFDTHPATADRIGRLRALEGVPVAAAEA